MEAIYDPELRAIRPEVVMPFRAWLDSLPAGDVEFISTDFGPFRAGLVGTRFEGRRLWNKRALATAIGRTALKVPARTGRLSTLIMSGGRMRSCLWKAR